MPRHQGLWYCLCQVLVFRRKALDYQHWEMTESIKIYYIRSQRDLAQLDLSILGLDSIWRWHLTSIGNPIVEIRRSYERLISTMGFPILVRWQLYIESGPWWHQVIWPKQLIMGQFIWFYPSLDNIVLLRCSEQLIFSCDQVGLSFCPSARLWHLFHYVPVIASWNFQGSLPLTKMMSMQKLKVRGQRSRSQRSKYMYPFPDCNSSVNPPRATKWCTKLEASWKRCPIVFQGHPSNFKVTGKNIADFDPNWALPDCNSSLNWLWNDAQSLMWYIMDAV